MENGDHLTAPEFLRRYQAMPHLKKAELIEGIVYMGSPVRYASHGRPDLLVQTWLGTYEAGTPGVEAVSNTTTQLDVDNVPQPGTLLRVIERCGGRSRVEDKDYLDFPGLWLDVQSAVALQTGAVLRALQAGLKSRAHRQFVARLGAARSPRRKKA